MWDQCFYIAVHWLDSSQDDDAGLYKVCKSSEFYLAEVPSDTIVRLSSIPSLLEKPGRNLLALHAACSKIMHDSGMAEFVVRWLDEYDDGTTFREDGSSVNLFDMMSDVLAIYVHWFRRDEHNAVYYY